MYLELSSMSGKSWQKIRASGSTDLAKESVKNGSCSSSTSSSANMTLAAVPVDPEWDTLALEEIWFKLIVSSKEPAGP